MKFNTFVIYTGDSKILKLKAIIAGSFSPLDLTNCTEIDVALPLAGGGFSHRLLTASDVSITSPASLGTFQVPVDEELSTLLKIGEFQSFDVTFTIAGEILTVRYYQALTVFERPILELS